VLKNLVELTASRDLASAFHNSPPPTAPTTFAVERSEAAVINVGSDKGSADCGCGWFVEVGEVDKDVSVDGNTD
jgi:hypothetical protein